MTIMGTSIKSILILVMLLFVAYTYSFAQSYQLADQFWKQAQEAQKNGRNFEAAELYVKSAEAEQNSPKPRLNSLFIELKEAGFSYYKLREYDKALKYYEAALTIAKNLKNEIFICDCLNLIGIVYGSKRHNDTALTYYEESLTIARGLGKWDRIESRLSNIGSVLLYTGQFDKALKYFEEALAIKREHGKEHDAIPTIMSIGQIYKFWGQFDRALKYYEEALDIGKKFRKEEEIPKTLNNIGMVYYAWAQYDKALKYFEEALPVSKKLGLEDNVAVNLNNIGLVYKSKGQFIKALNYHDEALTVARKQGKEEHIAIYLSNIGLVYRTLGQYDSALKNFEEALIIDRKLGRADQVATRLANIGSVYQAWSQYDKALKYYEESLALNKKKGRENEVAMDLHNTGSVYYSLKQFDKAIDYFNSSITLIEKLRKTATGAARRDYLARMIWTYGYLIHSYVREQDLQNAFSTIENSRAKLLSERLSGSDSLPIIPSVKLIQKEIMTDTAIISFANMNWHNPVAMVIINNNITGIELDKKKFLEALQETYNRPIEQMLAGQRGMKVISTSEVLDQKPQGKSATSFDDVINYYRSQLTDASSAINSGTRGLRIVNKAGDSVKAAGLERQLYDFLIKPIASQLKGKKRLIIIPDGVLAYLPFETLMDENNSYLVEKYDISYTQSMGIMDMLNKRIYPAGRKPMLAFGGAVYNELSYNSDMITNEKQLLALANNVYSATRSKRALGDAYGSLGMAKWDNLPGTLDEVEAISNTVKGTKVVTGRDVTENRVKQMSESGELSKYKVVHFATHGIVVPEIPELSAIVLSQIKNQPAGEDGYLRMDKIEELKMNADFVNLSACETGLGKIFGGEGVVGLTQSFLLAGANGLSASLWSVNDVSTSRFMVALYNEVEQKKNGYGDAIADIKRDFIKGKFGDAYKSPYYWAPFVYYGKLQQL